MPSRRGRYTPNYPNPCDNTPMPETTTGYHPALVEHFERPRNAGAMVGADAEAFVTNPVCGDSMRIFLRFEDGRVAAASFLTSGCPAAIGTSSAATELLIGRAIDEAAALSREDYAAAVGGLPKSKLHCSVLAAAAVREAIANWRADHPAAETAPAESTQPTTSTAPGEAAQPAARAGAAR